MIPFAFWPFSMENLRSFLSFACFPFWHLYKTALHVTASAYSTSSPIQKKASEWAAFGQLSHILRDAASCSLTQRGLRRTLQPRPLAVPQRAEGMRQALLAERPFPRS